MRIYTESDKEPSPFYLRSFSSFPSLSRLSILFHCLIKRHIDQSINLSLHRKMTASLFVEVNCLPSKLLSRLVIITSVCSKEHFTETDAGEVVAIHCPCDGGSLLQQCDLSQPIEEVPRYQPLQDIAKATFRPSTMESPFSILAWT